MKADRRIYLLLLIVFLHSCRDGDIQKLSALKKSPQKEKYVPTWHPPQVPEGWYTYLPPSEPQKLEVSEFKAPEPPIVLIERDTIKGIAIRAPGKIIIEEKIDDIAERDAEEAIFDISYTSTNRYVSVNFDNDIFNNTDYYYTNGVRIDYVSHIFASSPLSYPMLPYRKSSMNYHGMTVVQNMYTPTNPDTVQILIDDRPFAAYLYMGHFKNTLSSKNRYRQYSEIDIGLMGPGSLGGFVQGQIHEIPPVGWENQIQNDLVLNYTAVVEKGLYNPGPFDLNVFAEGQLGTLYTNIAAGTHIRAGRLNPYFVMPRLAKPNSIEGSNSLKWQYGIFVKAKVRLVVYDATLQGGILNNNNNYMIPAENIERFVLQASGGVFFAFKQLGFMYEQFYISPEFKDALDFRWGRINLTYCF